jgi:hypothetical protein
MLFEQLGLGYGILWNERQSTFACFFFISYDEVRVFIEQLVRELDRQTLFMIYPLTLFTSFGVYNNTKQKNPVNRGFSIVLDSATLNTWPENCFLGFF